MKIFKTLLKDFKKLMVNDGGFWVPLAMAAYGAYQGHQAEQQEKRNNRAAAVQTEFAPYTGMGPGKIQNSGQNFLTGAVTGGVSGMGMQQNINKAGGWKNFMGMEGDEPSVQAAEDIDPTIMVDATQGALSQPKPTFGGGQQNPWSLMAQKQNRIA